MKRWTDYLDSDVYVRLCDCVNTKADIKNLVEARWQFMKETGKVELGFTKQDAIVQVLDILDANSQWELADITHEEYEQLMYDV